MAASLPHEHVIPEPVTKRFEAEHPTAEVKDPPAVPEVLTPPAAETRVEIPDASSESQAETAPVSETLAATEVERAPSAEEQETPAIPRTRKPRAHRSVEKPPEDATPPVEPAVEAEALPARPTAPLELALEGMPEPRPVMRLNRREPAGSTSLVATAYIGIGNKLHLRGDGPGLSWERGVPMQFLAIGKWGWTTTEATVPVTCRVYRNDDTPMLEENIVIDPGTKAEITPKF